MAIVFPEGTQTYPGGVIQARTFCQTATVYGQNQQNQWQTFFTWTNALTVKGDTNSKIILSSSVNADINGGSAGHFWRWMYSINQSNWYWFGTDYPQSASNRVHCHYQMSTDNGRDQVLRTPWIEHRGFANNTQLSFRLEGYQISGASQFMINRATDDSDNSNSGRTTSTVTVWEVNNP